MTEKSIYFASLGCVKNRVDSEVMIGVAMEENYRLVNSPEEADVLVVNTCGFIQDAKKESIDVILELAACKKDTDKKLVVTGCLAQRYAQELSQELLEVDAFLGSSDMLKLRDVLRGSTERMLVGNPADWLIRATDPRRITQSHASTYLKIAEGCNRSCSFCEIPSMRGKQRSRSADDVLQEAAHLVEQGVLELNLISQDTVSYGRDLPAHERIKLHELVQRVADLPGLRWVRLFYLYPETLDEGLLDLLANHPRVVPYVDMPLQHAADAMLKRMRRGHGLERQKRVVERLKKAVPNLTFRTAFIVGHPGETEEEFQELCKFVEWAQFEHVALFRYSDEETCRSHALSDKVSPLVAWNRYRHLNAVQRRIARAKNRAKIGQTVEVLVEGPSEEHAWVMQGRHAGQAPEIDGHVFLSGLPTVPGEMRRVLLTQATDYDLVGEVQEDPAAGDSPPRKSAPRKIALPMLPAQKTWS